MAMLLVSIGVTHQAMADPGVLESNITREALFSPAKELGFKIEELPATLQAEATEGLGWGLQGKIAKPAAVVLSPESGQWDLSAFSLFSITLRNAGAGTLLIKARLNNPGAADWANSSQSQAYVLPGETGTVTIAYPRAWDEDDSPKAFEAASAKPNGWREHWKTFDPSQVTGCRLVIESNEESIKLDSIHLSLAWPYGKEANQSLLDQPHIDRFGQSIPMTWENKVFDEEQLKEHAENERALLQQYHHNIKTNQYGGFLDGPKLKATGHFRTDKHDGKWWLVDPDGRLFWSTGICTVGNRTVTPLSEQRRPLFEELPEPGTSEHEIGLAPYPPYGRWGLAVDFLRLNTMRKYGENWEQTSRDITHRRLNAWGVNTLGAWSEQALLDDKCTAFTEILHIWPGPHALENTPDPFAPGFEQRLFSAVAKLANKRADDPWMIGVFIDNEIVWHNDYAERILTNGPKQPAYQAFVNHLQQHYPTIDKLNTAWGTNAEDWSELTAGKTAKWKSDRIELFGLVADRYYGLCKRAVKEHLPNHLYLGSRVHTCPNVVAEQIAKHVDVFSINHYAPLAGTAQLPKDADLPVMITEFHFGTLDRGVVGMSLSPVHDQTQRSRSFAGYVLAGVLHPNVVGAHWFAYCDHSTVGRPNENYQIGFIDITDQPYPEMTRISQALCEQMYQLRLSHQKEVMEVIHHFFMNIQ